MAKRAPAFQHVGEGAQTVGNGGANLGGKVWCPSKGSLNENGDRGRKKTKKGKLVCHEAVQGGEKQILPKVSWDNDGSLKKFSAGKGQRNNGRFLIGESGFVPAFLQGGETPRKKKNGGGKTRLQNKGTYRVANNCFYGKSSGAMQAAGEPGDREGGKGKNEGRVRGKSELPERDEKIHPGGGDFVKGEESG